MNVAVETIPPFAMAGTRFLIAGISSYLFLRMRGAANPSWRQWKSAAMVGCFLMVGGNGLVTWSGQKIPSGVAAVVITTMPLWMTIFDWLFFRGKRPDFRVVSGLLLGFGGIVLLIGPREIYNGEMTLDPFSLGVLMLAPMFWAFGSLFSRSVDLPENVLMSASLQMICGGFVLEIAATATGEFGRIAFAEMTIRSIFAMAYLTVFGSIVALSAYGWLLKNAAASRVATYTYVNPVIAVFLGWLILGEVVTWQTTLAVGIIIVGVILIVTNRQKQQPETTERDLPESDQLVAPAESNESCCVACISEKLPDKAANNARIA